LPNEKIWPCLFTKSDTTGEKDFEEFYKNDEILDFAKFTNIGIVKNILNHNEINLNNFSAKIKTMKLNLSWTKKELLDEFIKLIPDFQHKETGKYLDSKM